MFFFFQIESQMTKAAEGENRPRGHEGEEGGDGGDWVCSGPIRDSLRSHVERVVDGAKEREPVAVAGPGEVVRVDWPGHDAGEALRIIWNVIIRFKLFM